MTGGVLVNDLTFEAESVLVDFRGALSDDTSARLLLQGALADRHVA